MPEGRHKPKPPHKKSSQKAFQTYAKYATLSFQMVAIVLLGVLGGRWLDDKLGFEKPVLTAVLAILAVALAVYYAVKDLLKK